MSVNSNRFTAQCKECHYGMSGRLFYTSSGQPVDSDAMHAPIAHMWVAYGSGSADDMPDGKTEFTVEVTLTDCNIDSNFLTNLIRTRDDFPGWFDNEEDLKNV